MDQERPLPSARQGRRLSGKTTQRQGGCSGDPPASVAEMGRVGGNDVMVRAESPGLQEVVRMLRCDRFVRPVRKTAVWLRGALTARGPTDDRSQTPARRRRWQKVNR